MKILIVNDDSIHADGIRQLAQAAMELGEVTVVAPSYQCSAMSQRITIRETLTVKKAEDFPVPVKAAWEVDGSPADCVMVALYHLLKEKPDFVFSGVNAGWNVGCDISHSGTLGAAFEALMLGVPAIAFSNSHEGSPESARYLEDIARELTAMEPDLRSVWNVNFPAGEPKGILRDRTVAPIRLFREHYVPEEQPDGSVQLRLEGTPLTADDPVPAGSDLEAVLKGYISVGKVRCTAL